MNGGKASASSSASGLSSFCPLSPQSFPPPAVESVSVAALTTTSTARPTKAPPRAVESEKVLARLFHHPDSHEFQMVKPILAVVLASCSVISPPLPAYYNCCPTESDCATDTGGTDSTEVINRGTHLHGWVDSLTTPISGVNMSAGHTGCINYAAASSISSPGAGAGAYASSTNNELDASTASISIPLGLLAASLEISVSRLLRLLFDSSEQLHLLLHYNWATACRLMNEDDASASVNASARSIHSYKWTSAHLQELGDTSLVPTALFLRGGIAYHLSSRDSCRSSGWACAGPSITAGGSGAAVCGWGSNSIGVSFSIDVAAGHNMLAALSLRNCGNKSVAVEHRWQTYMRDHGIAHLSRSSRGLRQLTKNIRKLDETAEIRYFTMCIYLYLCLSLSLCVCLRVSHSH